MFDPERDTVPARGRYYHRLIMLVTVGVMAIIAAWPSITVYRASADPEQKCVAAHELMGARHPACEVEAGRRLMITAAVLTLVLIGALAAAYRFDRGRRRSLTRPPASHVLN